MTSLYKQTGIIAKLRNLLDGSECFQGFTKPTARKLIWIILAMLATGALQSVRSLHTEFLAPLGLFSLNTLYHALAYAKRPQSLGFARVITRWALRIIPEQLQCLPRFLCVDDTLIPKFGRKFEDVGILFDHAAHDGRLFKNGHCLVCVMLCVPVRPPKPKGAPVYLSLPLKVRVWKKGGASKLQIAQELLLELMPEVSGQGRFIALCDSWYPKAAFLSILSSWKNLELIAAVRSDTAIYALPGLPTGKRGRPRLRGEKMNINDFSLTPCGIRGLTAGTAQVRTRIFDTARTLTAAVTGPADGKGSRRLYLSTLTPEELHDLFGAVLSAAAEDTKEDSACYAPGAALLHMYRIRWNVEVAFYELKTFWGLRLYKVRSAQGIDLLLNLIILSYSLMKLLPWLDASFRHLREESAQKTRVFLGEQIRIQVFFSRLVENGQKAKIPGPLAKAAQCLIGLFNKAA